MDARARRMTRAPRGLADYLPVTYESETNLGGEMLKIAPTLLLIAFWGYMMRGGIGNAMGGGGGKRFASVGISLIRRQSPIPGHHA